MKQKILKISSLSFLILMILLSFLQNSWAVAEGSGSNDSCAEAQDFGAVGLPFTLDGNLDGAVTADIDYFKFSVTPESAVEITLKGNKTNPALSLLDGITAVYDSNCNFIVPEFADDTNGTKFIAPPDGSFIVAVGCCDFFPPLGGNGTYQFSLQPVQTIGGISGRVVDAASQAPLPGDSEPFANAQLYRCEQINCFDFKGTVFADSTGQFNFTNSFNSPVLEPGYYQLRFSATNYNKKITDVTVAAGEKRDLGTIGLQVPVPIGSISGRVLDSFSNDPLAGNVDPFVAVDILYCGDEFECSNVNSVPTDKDGKFLVASDNLNNPLKTGEYLIIIRANQYEFQSVTLFIDQADENRNVGDILLKPLPIGISNVTPDATCKDIPKKGGSCQVTIKVRNGQDKVLDAELWSLVNGLGDFSFPITTFQPKANQRITLQPGASKFLKYDFTLPELPIGPFNNITVCQDIYFGLRPNAQWNVVERRNLACFSRPIPGGNFKLLPTREAQILSKRFH